MKDERSRVWTIVFYPESCSPDFIRIIDSFVVPALLSPLHHSDDEVSKDHYHLILSFDGKKSYEQVLSLANQLNSNVIERVKSIKAMSRYLIHYDNLDKEQFDSGVHSLTSFHGFDFLSYFEDNLNSDEICSLLEDIIINSSNLYELIDLINYLKAHELFDCLRFIRSENTYYVNQLLNSNYRKYLSNISKNKLL